DLNHMEKYVDDTGSPRWRDLGNPLQTKINSSAPLEMLKHGYNLAAIPDSADSPYYRWWIVHPWPDNEAYDDPHNREKRDARALRLRKRGKLFERS
ncbi:MAG: hypothetical protein ACYTGV_11945, partial [Planctomycetota bacterium]